MKRIASLHQPASQHEHGFVLVLVIAISLVLSVVAVSVLSVESTKYAKTSNDISNDSAIYAAEAGVSDTLARLNGSPTFFTGYTTKKQFYSNESQGKAEYTTSVTDNGNNTATISSTGYLSHRASDTIPYMTKTIKVLAIISKTPITENILAGPGGLIVAGTFTPWFGGPSSTAGSVYSRGKITLNGSTTSLGTAAKPATVTAANIGCGAAGVWPQPCASNDPPLIFGGGNFGSGAGTIYGTVCATNQVSSANILPGSTGSGLQAGCIAPDYGMPYFDRKAFTDAATVSTNRSPCGYMGGSATWPDKARITGNVNIGSYTYPYGTCTITVAGDVYIKGDFTVDNGSRIQVADSVGTKRPTIVVSGKVRIVGGSAGIFANASNTPVNIISFGSTDTTCNNTDSCTSISPTNLYNSNSGMFTNTWAGFGSSSPGITIENANGGFSNTADLSGLVAYSYFSTTTYMLSGDHSMRGLGGQGVIINPGGAAFWNNAGNLTVTDSSPFNSVINRFVYTIGDYLPVYN